MIAAMLGPSRHGGRALGACDLRVLRSQRCAHGTVRALIYVDDGRGKVGRNGGDASKRLHSDS